MLYNDLLRNTTLSTDYGVKEVDEIGVVKGLTQAQEKEIGKLHGFTYNEDKKQTQSKKSETDSKDNKETKTESKNEPKKQSTKTQQNKTTPKKTTTTKTTDNKTTKTTNTKQSK